MQHLLGLTQYLSKFLPLLPDIAKPLREITQKETEWVWDHTQQSPLDMLRKAVTNTLLVLCYYNLGETSLQCDASQSELWATLMLNGQLVAYDSRALTIWSPHLIKDIVSLERIQRRATKFILGTHSLNYRDRLVALKLFPLTYYFEPNDLFLFPNSKPIYELFCVHLCLILNCLCTIS